MLKEERLWYMVPVILVRHGLALQHREEVSDALLFLMLRLQKLLI